MWLFWLRRRKPEQRRDAVVPPYCAAVAAAEIRAQDWCPQPSKAVGDLKVIQGRTTRPSETWKRFLED